MSYTRKTIDQWYLYVNYGQGWEHELTEESRKEALQRLKEYHYNCNYPVKIKKVRVKK